jgi:hypothetical protein
MRTIFYSFRVWLDSFQSTGTAIKHGFAHGLTDVEAATNPGTKVPLEIAWSGGKKGFEVAVKLVRNSVRTRKSSKRGSPAGAARAWGGD